MRALLGYRAIYSKDMTIWKSSIWGSKKI